MKRIRFQRSGVGVPLVRDTTGRDTPTAQLHHRSRHECPTEASAQKAVAALRANINAETPRAQIDAISFSTLAQHYREKELCEGAGKTFAAIRTNEGYLERWILPRWSSYRLKIERRLI